MDEKSQDLPNFSGKVLNITLIDDESDRDLMNPEFEMQAGSLFLVGEVPADATTSGWSDGATGAVLWNRISSYLIFDSLEQYQAATKVSREHDQCQKEPT